MGDGTEPEPLDWLDRLDRLSRDPGSNPTVTALQQLASESAAQAAGRQSALDELAHDEVSILESAWGMRLRLPARLENDSSGKDVCGRHEIPEHAGKGQFNQADLTKLAATLDQLDLVDSPKCPLDPVDRKDFIAYRDTLKVILGNLSKLANPSNPSNPSKAFLQNLLGDCARDSIGPCFVLTDPAREAAERGLLRTIATEEQDVGYTVAHTTNGSKVLIIGVTGQSTMTAVSQTNLRMCAGTRENSTNAFGPCGDRISAGSGLAIAADPVPITEAIVRGAELQAADLNERPFDKIVVMAQMPHTEAEVLSERVWKILKLANVQHPVDAVLSEAESGYETPQLTISFPASAQNAHPAPVVSPVPSYSSQPFNYPGQVSRLTLDSGADQSFSMTNQPDGIFTPPPVQGSSPTTIALLSQLMAKLQPASASQTNVGTSLTNNQNAAFADLDTLHKAEFALLQDLQKSSRPKADVVLLQSRDVELDEIGPGYSGYEACAGEKEHPDLCQLRIALDRIFWKGDYLEYVAVTGKNLKSILSLSESKMAEQAQLADYRLHAGVADFLRHCAVGPY